MTLNDFTKSKLILRNIPKKYWHRFLIGYEGEDK